MKYFVILSTIFAFDMIWWALVDRRLRRLPRAALWRVLLAAYVVCLAAFPITLFVLYFADRSPTLVPFMWPIIAYLWHLGIAPMTLLAWGGLVLVRKVAGKFGAGKNPATATAAPSVDETARDTPVTRRAVLANAAFAIVPPFVTGALGAYSVNQLGTFRVRRTEVALPTLPADLDGVTIAHVTDLHIGRFLPPDAPRHVAEAVNALAADLVVFTGDLLDVTCWDARKGIDFLRRLDPRHGLAIVQGNHDGMVDNDLYEPPMRDAGVPLLINQASLHRIPGRATPIQLLGLAWGELLWGHQIKTEKRPANRRFRDRSDEYQRESIALLAGMRQPGAFPVTLVHHPHAFDDAADAGLPLTLAGHTHGGQIMLTERIGGGPVRFKYWSGAHERGGSKLLISSGVGNWFPFRLNAPQEIVHVTLRRGSPSN